jgi:hypothetical protein
MTLFTLRMGFEVMKFRKNRVSGWDAAGAISRTRGLQHRAPAAFAIELCRSATTSAVLTAKQEVTEIADTIAPGVHRRFTAAAISPSITAVDSRTFSGAGITRTTAGPSGKNFVLETKCTGSLTSGGRWVSSTFSHPLTGRRPRAKGAHPLILQIVLRERWAVAHSLGVELLMRC